MAKPPTTQEKIKRFEDKGWHLALTVDFSDQCETEPSQVAKKLLDSSRKEITQWMVQMFKSEFDHMKGVDYAPLKISDIKRCIELVEAGDTEMQDRFGRWINNPVIHQNKMLELIKERA